MTQKEERESFLEELHSRLEMEGYKQEKWLLPVS